MKLKNIKNTNRIILVCIAVAIISIIFLPIWNISLQAPQYPEGVRMTIYSSYVGGEINIVNSLNHYIGMKNIEKDDFPEFVFLNYIFIAFAVLFLITVFSKKRMMLYIITSLYVIFAIVILVDFYIWEYKYGHNLNPEAPIRIPGFYFQPPLIGGKQILNFYIVSLPALGGWIFIATQFLSLFLCYVEFKLSKKYKYAV